MQGWRQELLIVLPIGVIGTLVALWNGHPLLFSLIVTAYLVWHLLQVHLFYTWQKAPDNHRPPFAFGVWGAILELAQTQRRRANKSKRKLRRSLASFRESSNALPDATLILDQSGRMEWWNENAGLLLRLDSTGDLKRDIGQRLTDPIFKAYLDGGDYSRPLQIPVPGDDSTSLEIRIVPYGKGKRLLQARDITRLQQLEVVRRDFVANVSHEMRTPLTVVLGYLETIAECQDEAPLGKWRFALNQMQQQADRMQRIVVDLLTLSRLESRQQVEDQELVDVTQLLVSIKAEAIHLSGGKHRIHLTSDADLKLRGVKNELESAFSNLVFNAVRYTPTGGSVVMHWYVNGDKACFSVRDNGIGIAPEHIPRLTERFYRVDVGRSRQSGGTGLGLAIVKHVLAHHDSVLEIESEPDRGSLFSCTFPDYRVDRSEPQQQLSVLH